MKEIIYGINPVMGALQSGAKITDIYLVESKFEKEIDTFKKAGIKISPLSNLNFDDHPILEGNNVQGIVAFVIPKQLLSVKEIILISKKQKENPILVISDKITDPQNIGAILRNIAAFDAQGLIIPKFNQSPINATVHKASAGYSFKVNIAQTSSMSNAVKELKEAGFWIVDTRMDGKMSIEQLRDYNAPLVIVLGSEGKGVSPGLSKQADMSLSVKMSGDVESLNVSATSAIILHGLQK